LPRWNSYINIVIGNNFNIGSKAFKMGKKGIMKNRRKSILENQLVKQQAIIHTVEKEIYENISQCLCLARLQLGNIDLEKKEQVFAVIGEANLLIGKAVMDLRNLARQLLQPDFN
jgi:serine phosphatase RsbU (regulator of sigma subunit)